MEPTITVTRQRLQVIYKSHLSLRLSVYINAIDDEVTARITKASVIFSVFLQCKNTFVTSSSLAQINIDLSFAETSFKRYIIVMTCPNTK